MIVQLMAEQHLEFLSLNGDCTCSSESTHVKMPYYWKSHITANFHFQFGTFCSESSTFIIQQSTSDKQDSGLHAVTKVPQETMKRYYDDVIVPGKTRLPTALMLNHRLNMKTRALHVCIDYRSYITIIKELSGNERSG